MAKAASDAVLNFPEKLYVGVQSRKPFCTTTYPLAFATPWGTDSAFRKRKETVDNWVGQRFTQQVKWIDPVAGIYEKDANGHAVYEQIDHGEYEPEIINNVPIAGFSVDQAVERWSTSNKMFRINDPRGFQLEISADNLADLIINSTLDKGVIQEPLIWSKNGAKVFLTRLDHESYLQHLQPKVARAGGSLKPGDVVRLGVDKSRYVFLGEFHLLRFGLTTRYVEIATGNVMPDGWSQPYSYSYQRVNTHQSKYFTQGIRDPKPWHVYKPLDNNYYPFYIARKPKKSDVIEEGHVFEPLIMGDAFEPTSNDYGFDYAIPFETNAGLMSFNIDGAGIHDLHVEKLRTHRHDYRRTYDPQRFLGEI
jgi:hypothetical protein